MFQNVGFVKSFFRMENSH